MKTLERRLDLASVIAISIAAMLGSGLFVLPGIATTVTGPSVWLAYLVAGLCVLPASLSKAELATAMPESGGTYIYIDRTFGPLAGTITGLGLWFSLLLKSAFALVGFSAYLDVLAHVPLKPVALALLAFVTLLNIVGVRKVGKVQTAVVLLVIVSLSLLCLQGARTFQPELLEPEFSHGSLGFWSAVSLVYISYAGVTKVAAVAEEVEKPERNLPIGILASLGLVTALYCSVTLVLVGNVPQENLHGDLHPIYSMASKVAGTTIGWLAALLGVVTMTSMANSGLLAASRFPFAMSRKALLPNVFQYVSGRYMTPVPAIALTASLMALAIVTLNVVSIAKLASSLLILGYMIENAAVIVLRESSIQWYKPNFRSPFYPFVQLLGIGLGFWLLFMLGASSLAAVAVIVAAGMLLFFGFGRRQTARKGVLGRLGPRRDLLEIERPTEHVVLPQRAAVVVALLGRARAAEALAELGDALAGGAKVEVIHITDVPEQLSLNEHLEEDPLVGSLRRRIRALATRTRHDIDFDAVATHDHIHMISDISRRVHCEWLVMEWHGRTERGVLSFNPLGWLINHLACNLAVFKDVGSRSVTEILVYPEPGPHDALVAMTADQLAQMYSAKLTFVRYVPEEADSQRVRQEHDYLEQLGILCAEMPAARIVRGKDELLTVATLTAQFDLLIVGAPPDLELWRQLKTHRADRLMRRAACSVLRLKAPRRLVDRTFRRRHISAQVVGTQLTESLLRGCIRPRLDHKTKAALFTYFAESFAAPLGLSREKLEESLWERERTQNTSLGKGLAIPHATVTDAKQAYVGVFTTKSPIDYRAADGIPVDVFVVIVAPPSDRNTHLQILSSLARLVMETPFLERVRAADNESELLGVLLASRSLSLSSEAKFGSEQETGQHVVGDQYHDRTVNDRTRRG